MCCITDGIAPPTNLLKQSKQTAKRTEQDQPQGHHTPPPPHKNRVPTLNPKRKYNIFTLLWVTLTSGFTFMQVHTPHHLQTLHLQLQQPWRLEAI